jgi:hypothetical protein
VQPEREQAARGGPRSAAFGSYESEYVHSVLLSLGRSRPDSIHHNPTEEADPQKWRLDRHFWRSKRLNWRPTRQLLTSWRSLRACAQSRA